MTNESGGQILEFMQTTRPLLGAMAACVFLILFTFGVLRLVNYSRKFKQKTVLLEITPSAFLDKVPTATAQLFSVFHELLNSRPFSDVLLGYAPSFSLEIVSSRDKGIRYLVRAEKDSANIIRSNIQAYVTNAKVTEVEDYLCDAPYSSIQIFKQANHFAHPLNVSRSLGEHDPVAYMTSATTKLDSDELMSFQLVVTPTVIAEAGKIDYRMRRGFWFGSNLEKSSSGHKLLQLLWKLIKLPIKISWEMLYAFVTNRLLDSTKTSLKPRRASYISPAEQKLLEEAHVKLNQDLFYVDLRMLTLANSKAHLKQYAQTFVSSLAVYARPNWQLLKPTRSYLPKLGRKIKYFVFVNRLPSLLRSRSNVLGAGELAALFHFPHSRSARTNNAEFTD